MPEGFYRVQSPGFPKIVIYWPAMSLLCAVVRYLTEGYALHVPPAHLNCRPAPCQLLCGFGHNY